MEKYSIRTACAEDQQILTELKTTYIRSLYQGYIPQERLRELDPTPYETRIADFLAMPDRQVLLCMEEDKPMGYLAIGDDPEDARFGIIFGAACAPQADHAVRDALIVAAAEYFAAQGKQQVHIWLLRDNFRARFLFEQFDFKSDGTLRTQIVEGHEMQLTRYVYRIPSL
ncbi:MAG: GNAT family N-acetyltransferase [Clostridia bacterium]|nr:GNAT family N-acetyltransferase [Clostridia bacterium]